METINRVEIQGVVVDGMNRGVTRPGSGWIRFQVRVVNEYFTCVAFGDVEGEIGDLIEPDAQVNIIGELKMGRCRGHKTLSVNVLHCRILERVPMPRERRISSLSCPMKGFYYRDLALSRKDIPPV